MGSRHVDDALDDGRHDGRWNDGFDEWLHGPMHCRPVVTRGCPGHSCRRVTAQGQLIAKWRWRVLGGMFSSLLHVLIVTPVIFFWLRERQLKKQGIARANGELAYESDEKASAGEGGSSGNE